MPLTRTCSIGNVGNTGDLGFSLQSHQLGQHVASAEHVAEVVLVRVPPT